MRKVVSAKALENFQIELEYETGEIIRLDCSTWINEGSIFEPLKDQDFFKSFRILDDGYILGWNDEIDMCADSLWYMAHPEEYRKYLKQRQFSQNEIEIENEIKRHCML